MDPAPWVFVVDTNQYSGNFERPLTAWITGCVGECGVGQAEADRATSALPEKATAWFEDHVVQVPDEHGCCRPTTAWATPGWFNDGMGNEWPSGADAETVRTRYIESVRRYHEPLISEAEARAAVELEAKPGHASWSESARLHRQMIADAEQRGPGHHPCYRSVAIFLDREPPKKILALMMERARSYLAWPERDPAIDITIKGFRLIRQTLRSRSRKVG